jgi:hypothetical protein
MNERQHLTGNPVFDYKAGFRALAQSVQRVLFYSGCLLTLLSVVSRFVPIANKALTHTLHDALWMGLGLFLSSAAWGFWWRSKLRSDFKRAYSDSP